MSSVYNTEPQPTASAILHTTSGDLFVELFAKQTPLTCRNFLQHCLDGYYDNTIFHRLVPGFIIQGGDPTGTGNGGESIYDGGAFGGDLDPWPLDQRKGRNAGPTGSCFKDEFHSRLKFNRRGLLGMANEGSINSNSSQFFFTLDKTAELDGKNTMFGRIAGDTIYNLMKMGETDLKEGTEEPLYQIKITSTEVLINPFEDMKKRQRVAVRTVESSVPVKKPAKKRKAGKQLLSFGDDDGDGDVVQLAKKPKFDTRLIAEVEEEEASRPKPKKAKLQPDPNPPPLRHEEAEPVKAAPKVAPPPPRVVPELQADTETTQDQEIKPEKSKLDKVNEEIAALKASMRRDVVSEAAPQKKLSAREQMIPENSSKGRKRRPGMANTSAADEAKALEILQTFRSRIEELPPEQAAEVPANDIEEHAQATNGAEDDEEVCDLHFIANCQSCKAWDKAEQDKDSDDEGWLSHSLSFAADKLGKDLSYRKKAEEELIVIDPLAKARGLQDERKSQKHSRGLDSRAKNAHMARASALAGRGAR